MITPLPKSVTVKSVPLWKSQKPVAKSVLEVTPIVVYECACKVPAGDKL